MTRLPDTDDRRRQYLDRQADHMQDIAGWIRRRAKAGTPLPVLHWEVWSSATLVGKVDRETISPTLTVRQVLELYAAALGTHVVADEYETLNVKASIGPNGRTYVQLSAREDEGDLLGKAGVEPEQARKEYGPPDFGVG